MMLKDIPKLPSINDCCGCAACVDSCKHDALSLREDKNGYYNIVINKDLCVGCGLCMTNCHILHQDKLIRSDPTSIRPLAGWSLDESLIRLSASGGVFAQLAFNMLKEGNTFVYGASLHEDSSVHHIEINNVNELNKLQNSKYQQSYSVGIYQQVKARLKAGNRVLFSGTPCQISALYVYLGCNEHLKRNLYTIEVICHGVPSNVIHRIGLKVNKAKRILAYRNKEEGKGWLFGRNNRLSYIMPDNSVRVMTTRRQDFIFRTYLSFSFSRKSCYSCKYAKMERVSDLTLGDFWGFQNSSRRKGYENLMGTSIILPNTDRGKMMIEKCKNLHVVDVYWKDFLPYNQNLYMPTNKFIFIGSDYIHWISKLPFPFQVILMQKGFSHKLFDKICTKFLSVLTRKVAQKKQNIQDAKCQEALAMVL